MSDSVHQEITLPATPEAIYQALTNAATHSAFTGEPADVSLEEGGACSWYGGKISGRNIELVTNQRIVWAWRAGNWDPGVYSIVRLELTADDGGTRLVLDQGGHPEGAGEHLASGWNERYWKPLRAYLEA